MHSEHQVSFSFRPIDEALFQSQVAESPYRIDACITQAFNHRGEQHKKLLINADIHSNGLSFSSVEHFSVGSKLCMMVDFNNTIGTVPMIGEVLFSIPNPDHPSEHWTGVEFVLMSLNAEELLLRQLSQLEEIA